MSSCLPGLASSLERQYQAASARVIEGGVTMAPGVALQGNELDALALCPRCIKPRLLLQIL